MSELKLRKLYLYDMSCIIHSGSKSSRSRKWNYRGVPTGGLNMFLTYMISDMKAMRDVKEYVIAPCFDSWTSTGLRRKQYSGYKQPRDKRSEIAAAMDKVVSQDDIIIAIIDRWCKEIAYLLHENGIEVSEGVDAPELLRLLEQIDTNIADTLFEPPTISGEEVKCVVSMMSNLSDNGKSAEVQVSNEADGTGSGYYMINHRLFPKNKWKSIPMQTKEIVALDYSVSIQLEIAKELSSYMGVRWYEFEGIEADDIIYSFVAKYPNTRTLIRSSDSDLYDCFLCNTDLDIWSVNGREELNVAANKRGVLFHKTFDGCVSDNVPDISRECAPYRQLVYDAMVRGEFNPYMVKAGGKLNIEPLLNIGVPAEYAEKIALNVYLVYPFIVDMEAEYTNINLDNLADILSGLRMKRTLARLGRSMMTSRQMNEYLESKAKRLPDFFKEWLGSSLYIDSTNESADNSEVVDVAQVDRMLNIMNNI